MDSAYRSVNYNLSELEHHYPKNVHILSNPFLLSHLAQLCSPRTFQPTINQLVDALYANLVNIIMNNEFPRKRVAMPTRMGDSHPKEGVFEGELIDSEQSAVSVNLARAGTFPSHICYNALNYVLNPVKVRQDHISINRATDDSNKVVGTNVSGHKIGGPIKDAIVLMPDPMGATGGTLVSALNIYKNEIAGPAKKYIAVHLIVTPEYLRKVTKAHPDLIIYAVRLDRGLSPADVFDTKPGTHWDRERGLNDKQYIVPGGGGFGEILNNSFV
ncbi:MAG: uracil phosphoribosyltransferase [Deltaproteobacteria bacterium]|nr:uracil phosphoribosyltransferase [Deltaproteobacteria bacterium]